MIDMVSIANKTYVMNIDQAKENWDKVNLVTIFEDMVDHAPENWEPSWADFYAARDYATSLNARGVYPTEYCGNYKKEVLFGAAINYKQWWNTVKSASAKCWTTAKKWTIAAWDFCRNFGKARRHKYELENFMWKNPHNFVLAWNPVFRSFDTYVEWCGEELAIKRVQQATGQA